MANEVELAWAAGFFEGEGSTVATRSGRRRDPSTERWSEGRRSYLKVQTRQSVSPGYGDGAPEVLVRLRAAIGGHILGPYWQRRSAEEIANGRGYRQPSYVWYAQHAEAQAVLSLLWPFLGAVKREQADAAQAVVDADHDRYGHTRSCGHAA